MAGIANANTAKKKSNLKNNFICTLAFVSMAFISFSILFSILLPQQVFASVTEVTTSASASRATTGTSVTITASVTASSTETTSVNFVSTPSGITVSDPAGGSYSSVAVSTSPTTKTFTISAGSANTYTYYVQAGSVQSTSATIVFVDPSAIVVTGDPSSTTQTSGSEFDIEVNMENSQSSSVTTSYSLNLPSGYSVTAGDASSDTITLGPNSIVQVAWTIKVGSASGTITFKVGSNSNAFSTSVTCSDCVTTSPSSVTAELKASASVIGSPYNRTFFSIAAETIKLIPETDLSNTNSRFTEISFAVKERVTDVVFFVQGFGYLVKPSDAPSVDPGKVYRYIKILTTNLPDEKIKNATVKFKVEKAWFTEEKVDASTIALYRYVNGKWDKLSTVKLTEDANFIYYRSTIPGFSYFTIAGEAPTTTATQPQETQTTTTTLPTGVTFPSEIIIGIIIIFVIVVAVLLFMRKNKK
ncbi:MAG TPA: PGF-pre-PGF domain-containing protein [archaeon]|nr:PGF-pre-PGF domain-containing protein [archaeon]